MNILQPAAQQETRTKCVKNPENRAERDSSYVYWKVEGVRNVERKKMRMRAKRASEFRLFRKNTNIFLAIEFRLFSENERKSER